MTNNSNHLQVLKTDETMNDQLHLNECFNLALEQIKNLVSNDRKDPLKVMKADTLNLNIESQHADPLLPADLGRVLCTFLQPFAI